MNKDIKNLKPVKCSDTSNTDDTDDTSNTSNTKGIVLSVLCITDVLDALFSDNISEKLLMILGKSKETFTFDKLAEELGKKPANVRQAVNRKKELFCITKPDGRKAVIQLSQLGIEEIQARIDRKKGEEEDLRQQERQKKVDKEKINSMEVEVQIFLKQCEVKREGKTLYLDYNELLINNPRIVEYLLDQPENLLQSINNHFDCRYDIKFINLPESININIENLRKENLNRLISIEGRLTSFGEVRPVITQITFECPSCGSTIIINQNYRVPEIKEPKRCSCGRKGYFRMIKRKEQNCSFLQLEDLQERTDNPHSQRVKAIIFDGLCDGDRINIFAPGNEVKCYGILKEVPVYKKGKQTLFLNWILEIIDAELIEKDIDISKFTEEEVMEIKELSAKINEEGLNPMLESFAPDIYGYNSIKGALALQLCNKRNDTKNKSIRNKSNILLIGDPGVAKSVLCNFAISVTQGGRRAVGGGSSAVGITASVVREEESIGGYRVEPGAMILAKDLLFIDELNNLQEEDKSKLQEGMSEQKVSINKANIHCEMKVTCGIISAANPKEGTFKEFESNVEEQFDIPTPILNRFDTIFVLRDIVNEDNDKKIASKMIKRHRESLEHTYNKSFLRKFFAYVKQFEEPEINDEMEEILKKVYFSSRKYNNEGVKINPRFLESLTRMSIASAKARLNEVVELKDIERALEIIQNSQYKIDTKKILDDLKC